MGTVVHPIGSPTRQARKLAARVGHYGGGFFAGQKASGRLGFQYLLAEISLDHVGIVFGLEMSRLARSNKDWHQLLELCAIFRTLLADQDGLYDPTDYNDRLLLGLKSSFS